MKKLVTISMVWALLAHGMVADCNAFGVIDPTDSGLILPGQNVGSGGTSNSGAALKVTFQDSSGFKDVRDATPTAQGFYFQAYHLCPAGNWALGLAKCSINVAGATSTCPTVKDYR